MRCALPDLPRNASSAPPPLQGHVPLAQRGEAEALVGPGVFVVADPDQGDLQQAHGGGEHLLARQAAPGEVGVDAGAELRQRAAERGHAVVLVGVAGGAPVVVIAVLLAAARVAAHRLDVAAPARADPHVGPGRRDHQPADALQRGVVAHQVAVGIAIVEPAGRADAADARIVVVDVFEPGVRRRLRPDLRHIPRHPPTPWWRVNAAHGAARSGA